ncbi:unnamed protein product [Vitrella brassicaformis CCMP3155]|uniref:SUN domain-containing protein n=3 Tax=Vitrella brassicaformis TaxID=1169539 RepID=A0A0G4G2N5_VITBC|nr:unnamed protein product [Vitrella brassicaformis CCMP3155]|eukprot:CEM22528.1 unnamed protein product [Vitrella brassicaformis CCMP3155]
MKTLLPGTLIGFLLVFSALQSRRISPSAVAAADEHQALHAAADSRPRSSPDSSSHLPPDGAPSRQAAPPGPHRSDQSKSWWSLVRALLGMMGKRTHQSDVSDASDHEGDPDGTAESGVSDENGSEDLPISPKPGFWASFERPATPVGSLPPPLSSPSASPPAAAASTKAPSDHDVAAAKSPCPSRNPFARTADGKSRLALVASPQDASQGRADLDEHDGDDVAEWGRSRKQGFRLTAAHSRPPYPSSPNPYFATASAPSRKPADRPVAYTTIPPLIEPPNQPAARPAKWTPHGKTDKAALIRREPRLTFRGFCHGLVMEAVRLCRGSREKMGPPAPVAEKTLRGKQVDDGQAEVESGFLSPTPSAPRPASGGQPPPPTCSSLEWLKVASTPQCVDADREAEERRAEAEEPACPVETAWAVNMGLWQTSKDGLWVGHGCPAHRPRHPPPPVPPPYNATYWSRAKRCAKRRLVDVVTKCQWPESRANGSILREMASWLPAFVQGLLGTEDEPQNKTDLLTVRSELVSSPRAVHPSAIDCSVRLPEVHQSQCNGTASVSDGLLAENDTGKDDGGQFCPNAMCRRLWAKGVEVPGRPMRFIGGMAYPRSYESRFDFASQDAGARIVDFSPHIKNVRSVLSPDDDRYLLVPCKAPTWFVIALTDDINLEQLALISLEYYASGFRHLQILGSSNYPTTDWRMLGEIETTPFLNKELFDLKPYCSHIKDKGCWVRYLKVRVLSHHRDEHNYYCALTRIQIFGTTVFSSLQSELSDIESKEDTADSPDAQPTDAPAPPHIEAALTELETTAASLLRKADQKVSQLSGSKSPVSHHASAPANRSDAATPRGGPVKAPKPRDTPPPPESKKATDTEDEGRDQSQTAGSPSLADLLSSLNLEQHEHWDYRPPLSAPPSISPSPPIHHQARVPVPMHDMLQRHSYLMETTLKKYGTLSDDFMDWLAGRWASGPGAAPGHPPPPTVDPALANMSLAPATATPTAPQPADGLAQLFGLLGGHQAVLYPSALSQHHPHPSWAVNGGAATGSAGENRGGGSAAADGGGSAGGQGQANTHHPHPHAHPHVPPKDTHKTTAASDRGHVLLTLVDRMKSVEIQTHTVRNRTFELLGALQHHEAHLAYLGGVSLFTQHAVDFQFSRLLEIETRIEELAREVAFQQYGHRPITWPLHKNPFMPRGDPQLPSAGKTTPWYGFHPFASFNATGAKPSRDQPGAGQGDKRGDGFRYGDRTPFDDLQALLESVRRFAAAVGSLWPMKWGGWQAGRPIDGAGAGSGPPPTVVRSPPIGWDRFLIYVVLMLQLVQLFRSSELRLPLMRRTSQTGRLQRSQSLPSRLKLTITTPSRLLPTQLPSRWPSWERLGKSALLSIVEFFMARLEQLRRPLQRGVDGEHWRQGRAVSREEMGEGRGDVQMTDSRVARASYRQRTVGHPDQLKSTRLDPRTTGPPDVRDAAIARWTGGRRHLGGGAHRHVRRRRDEGSGAVRGKGESEGSPPPFITLANLSQDKTSGLPPMPPKRARRRPTADPSSHANGGHPDTRSLRTVSTPPGTDDDEMDGDEDSFAGGDRSPTHSASRSQVSGLEAVQTDEDDMHPRSSKKMRVVPSIDVDDSPAHVLHRDGSREMLTVVSATSRASQPSYFSASGEESQTDSRTPRHSIRRHHHRTMSGRHPHAHPQPAPPSSPPLLPFSPSPSSVPSSHYDDRHTLASHFGQLSSNADVMSAVSVPLSSEEGSPTVVSELSARRPQQLRLQTPPREIEGGTRETEEDSFHWSLDSPPPQPASTTIDADQVQPAIGAPVVPTDGLPAVPRPQASQASQEEEEQPTDSEP